jgi:hypothetical protein
MWFLRPQPFSLWDLGWGIQMGISAFNPKRQKENSARSWASPTPLPKPLWVQKPQPGILSTLQDPHKNLNNCKRGQIPGLCQHPPWGPTRWALCPWTGQLDSSIGEWGLGDSRGG